jgi:uncharacterized protein with PhoU and TrkA domain
MEEVTLQAVQRAMPGHGRARINNSLLDQLGIGDNDEVDVVTPAGSHITVTVFADSLVDAGDIRLSQEDLKTLGIESGTRVVVRRKVPVAEQVKSAAYDLKDRTVKGIKGIEDAVSEKAADLKEGAATATRDIAEKGRELSSKIAEEVAPLGERISEAGRETAARIADLIPAAQISEAVDTGIKRLSPGDASRLKNLLLQNEGDVRAVVVSAETASGRTIRNLTIPPDVVIAAVQHQDNSLVIPTPDTVIASGDLVYLIGKEKALDYMSSLLEG